MKNFLRILIYIIIISTIILLVYFGNSIISNWNYFEFWGFMISLLFNFGLIAYRVDTKLYFTIHRILSKINNSLTTWEISGLIKFMSQDSKQHFEKFKQMSIEKYHIEVIEDFPERFKFIYDNHLTFTFNITKLSDNESEVFFKTTKLSVGYRQIDNKTLFIKDLVNDLRSPMQIYQNHEHYDLKISFENKNPYLGMWLKKIPNEEIASLDCRLVLPMNKDSINISKNSIFVESKSLDNLVSKGKNYILHGGY